jgi:nicotinamidase-related amidase
LLIVDVQNDFITGSLALSDCPAKQNGAEVVPIINDLIEKNEFNAIIYTQDWHPKDHCSFVENVKLRKISSKSPVLYSFIFTNYSK